MIRAEVETSGVDHEDKRIVVDGRVLKAHGFAVGMNLHGSQFLESVGKVEVGSRVVDPPHAASVHTVVFDPYESEDFGFEV